MFGGESGSPIQSCGNKGGTSLTSPRAHSWVRCAEVIQLPVELVLELSLLCWVMTRTVFCHVQTCTLLLLACPGDTFHTQQLKEPWNSFLHSDGRFCEGCYPRARLEESVGPMDGADHGVLYVLERGGREDRTWEGSRGQEKCILLAIMRGERQLVLSGQRNGTVGLELADKLFSFGNFE